MTRAALFSLCLLTGPAFAQTDDRSYLTAFLEDNLSGAGRQVVITGFTGALSSKARIAELTIADDQGVWLTLRDVALDWNRSALFSGSVSVNELSAAEIIVARAPVSAQTLPQPEAKPFNLPELPVSVQIGRVAADRISVGPDVLGQAVEGRFEAALSLSNGQGEAQLLLERQDDGPDGRLSLEASYSNDSRQLTLDLAAAEGPGGLVASALGLPGQPAAEFGMRANGPIGDIVADISLSTDGQPRLSGRIVTKSALSDIGFAANLSGNIAPLFLPDYAEFFGDRIDLIGSGTAYSDGRVDLTNLRLNTRALDLEGSFSLTEMGGPSHFALTGSIAHEDGAAVLLPLPSDLPVRIDRATFSLGYDKRQGDGWSGNALVYGLDRDDFQASSVSLTGSGRIVPDRFGATVQFAAEGLSPTDAAMARALGSVLSGEAVLFFQKGDDSLTLPRLSVKGEDYRALVNGGRIAGLSDALNLSGNLTASFDDLARLDGLANLPLDGAAEAELRGSFSPLSGAFDLVALAKGQELQTGNAMLDGLLKGTTRLTGRLVRDETGTRISGGQLVGAGFTADVDGLVASAASDIRARARIDNLTAMGPQFGGTLTVEARLTGPLETARITADASGKGLRSGNPELDKLLSGTSQLTADLALREGRIEINRATLANPEVTAEVAGDVGGDQSLRLQARLRNLGVLLPEFPGPVTVSGTFQPNSAGLQTDVAIKGPGGIDATVLGMLNGQRNDLVIRGRALAALANAFILPRAISGTLGFDLRMLGPAALSSLSGSVTLDGGRLSDPSLPFGFQNITARADLSGGQARLSASLPLSTAGKVAVAGTIGLAEPFSAALGLALQDITVQDPDLFTTRVMGELKLTGPLLGRPTLAGRIELLETEIRMPSTGFGGAAGLPDLRHIHEPADVRATRVRAGLLDQAVGSARAGRGDVLMDVTISAPNRVFVRGRGLDAELGGEVRLLGSLSALSPTGAFNLIRGRLDILGKRFNLTEALLQLEGDLIPFLRVVAGTQGDDIVTNVVIEGRADDPKVSFTSMPELPEEEVLAQLLFGQNLQDLSALQALQLASAVATLAGRGGGGVIERLRQGIGVDNLDVKTTADGSAELTAGKYISENAYTEVTVDQNGKSQIDLNLDLTDNITLRGRAGSDGRTGVGIFLEKDY